MLAAAEGGGGSARVGWRTHSTRAQIKPNDTTAALGVIERNAVRGGGEGGGFHHSGIVISIR